jgi:Zn-dependent protease
MARYFGIGTRSITLYPIGGVARLERMSDRPHEELLIAVAGPAVNVVIALALGLVVAATGVLFSWEQMVQSLPIGFLLGLLTANIFLVLFNMLPAFPMDGGRVLRALLTVPLGRLRATEVAAYLGVAVAVLMAAAGIYYFSEQPMLIVVAAFVLFAGQQELAATRHRERVGQMKPLDVLPAEAEPVVLSEPADGLGFTGAIWDARTQAWVLWHRGQPVGRFGYRSE